ncbi:hypothetical protein [Ochrobactrum chromiisoli]|uniref:Uncharacterized protein n=1 Tax=Ochrobactrum chromiisoli TaxID=2993941 RepID=A0ABT3QUQ6_9HYPH|nr:hypothetical protein [Ochrobactrum chromiisoli]MCX2699366.1 hypothetical protein [Ochrobactrum chromiisoli]
MFGLPKCGHCNGVGTSLKAIEPEGSNYKQMATVCQSCNAILGVSGYYDTGALLKKAEKERAEMKMHIASLEQQVYQLSQILSRR